MTHSNHLKIEDYVGAVQQADGATEVALRVHDHLIESCSACEQEWLRLGSLQAVYLDRLRELRTKPGGELPPLAEVSADPEALRDDESVQAEYVRLRRRALEEKSKILRTPADHRIDRIRRARRRFHSLLLAELLIEESRRRVRNHPAEAAEIAALLPHVLEWTRVEKGPPYGAVLLARGAAHRANALRIAGDLPAATRAFVELRRRLASRPLDDAGVLAEIASLEASLRIDQRHFSEAEKLLDQAALAAQHAESREALARIRIQQANLQQLLRHPAAVLPLLDSAAAALPADADPYLLLCTITGRVNALCDLERYAEARRLLHENLDAYEASEDPYSGATYRCLQGRIALGRRELPAAERAFSDSRDAFHALGRDYDAVLVSFYVAETYLAAGKISELRDLAAKLVPLFRSRGVEGEALASLHLLGRAVAAETLSAALLAELRHNLTAPSGASRVERRPGEAEPASNDFAS